ncbi:hypothetical protein M8C21_010700, partial [Ambrosia artemisiifolia]
IKKMTSADVELEQQIKEAGKQLLHPPDSLHALLPVLDRVEKLLSKVDQSPKRSMIEALKPSMMALIQDRYLKHSDVDVKVAAVFQLIVAYFEGLADQSSRSYNKRASILETVSKVWSCVIMLDLECDALIVEMFENFLKSVRDYHIDSIFSSMENIMVLVLEESEKIPAEMLKPLLAGVKKDNKGVLPIARNLVEGVRLKSAVFLEHLLFYVNICATLSILDIDSGFDPFMVEKKWGSKEYYEKSHNDVEFYLMRKPEDPLRYFQFDTLYYLFNREKSASRYNELRCLLMIIDPSRFQVNAISVGGNVGVVKRDHMCRKNASFNEDSHNFSINYREVLAIKGNRNRQIIKLRDSRNQAPKARLNPPKQTTKKPPIGRKTAGINTIVGAIYEVMGNLKTIRKIVGVIFLSTGKFVIALKVVNSRSPNKLLRHEQISYRRLLLYTFARVINLDSRQFFDGQVWFRQLLSANPTVLLKLSLLVP